VLILLKPIIQSQFWSKKPKKNWIKILRSYAKNPIQSKSDVSKLTGIAYTDVYGLVDELVDLKILIEVKPMEKRKEPGKKPIFFGLTKKGLDVLILDPEKKLLPEDFWKLMWTCYNVQYKSTENETIIDLNSIDEVLISYLKLHTKVNRLFSPILFDIFLDKINSNDLIKQDDLQEMGPFLKYVSINKNPNSTNISKSIKISKDLDEKENLRQVQSMMTHLTNNGFVIQKYLMKNHGMIITPYIDYHYSLSHVGLLILLRFLLKENKASNEDRVKDSWGQLKNDFTKTFELLSEKNIDLFPMLFGNSRIKKIRKTGKVGYYAMVERLTKFYSDEYQNPIFASHKEEIWTTINLQKLIKPVYHHRLGQVLNAGTKFLENWGFSKENSQYFKGRMPNDIFPKDMLQLLEKASKVLQYNYKGNLILSLAKNVVLCHQDHLDSGVRKGLKEKLGYEKHAKILNPVYKPLEKMLELEDINLFNKYNTKFDFTTIRRRDKIEFQTIGNIISFHFYTMMKFLIKDHLWKEIMEKDPELKNWYEEGLNTLIDFSKENTEQLETMKIKN